MLNHYARHVILASVGFLTACGSPVEPPPPPPHDAGTSDAPHARPCFPGEGVACPSGAVPYCYPDEPGAAPFDNCAPSCGDGSGVGAAWCCPDGTGSIAASCLDGGA